MSLVILYFAAFHCQAAMKLRHLWSLYMIHPMPQVLYLSMIGKIINILGNYGVSNDICR